MEKQYRTTVRSDNEFAEIPSVAVFTVDQVLANEIIRLAALVKANGLYKVEKFDYRTSFFEHDPVENPGAAEAAGDDNSVRTECDCLNVSEDSFWFSALRKHSDYEILTARQSISELQAHFGLSSDDGTPKTEDPSKAFVSQVANLSMWSYDRNDGTPYTECEEPGEGFLDSHCCLMALIEQARGLQQPTGQP